MKYKVIGKQVFYLADKHEDKWFVKETFKTNRQAEQFLKELNKP